MTDHTAAEPTTVEERVARHLAARDWLTDEDRWVNATAAFRTDYLTAARKVIALVRNGEPAPTDQDAAPTDWIDGHPQLEAIAAAVWEHCEHYDSGLIIDDPRNIAVAALAAVPPAPADQAAELANLRAMYDAVSKREHELIEERDRLTAELRRLAGEAQQDQPPVDRAAVYAEVAARLAADAEQGDKDGLTRIYRRSAARQVREWADEARTEAQQDPTQDGTFIPPAALGLPAGTLEAAEIGANRLDAWARTPNGRNFLAHALVQLARTGWLRTEPGEGFEPMPDDAAVARPGQPDTEA